jgi:uncharacterized protein (TIGR01777 family)
MNILITGANGLVGKSLQNKLKRNGINIFTLTSGQKKGENDYRWNTVDGIIDPLPVNQIHGVVHLAGAGIADKAWTDERKKEVLDSRVKASEFLFDAFKKAEHFPDFYITASGVGYYSQDNVKAYSEDGPKGDNFLAEVCDAWEKAADLFQSHCKVYKLRFGVILGDKGFIKEILKPAKFFAGAVLGSGKQIVPWVHLDDVVNVIICSIENKISPNIYNVVAPSENSLDEITRKAARLISRPVILPNIPSFLVKAIFGERSLMLLSGQRIYPGNLLHQGFKFTYKEIDTSLESILKK